MKPTLPLLAALLLACVFAAAARSVGFSVSILPATASTTAVTLNGVDQTPTFTATITVTGGSSATGWNVTAWAPLPLVSGNVLGAMVVTAQPSLGACSPGGNCSLPTPTGIVWPVTLGTTAGAAAKIYNAQVSSGNGNNTLTVIFGVKVPASALPGSYTTTLTIIGSSVGP